MLAEHDRGEAECRPFRLVEIVAKGRLVRNALVRELARAASDRLNDELRREAAARDHLAKLVGDRIAGDTAARDPLNCILPPLEADVGERGSFTMSGMRASSPR